jgi:hypothetical protein
MQELVAAVETRLIEVGGKQEHEVEYRLELHEDVLQWIKTHTNHSFNIDAEYNYEKSRQFPHGSVKVKLHLDEPSLNKLNKFLNPDKPRSKSQKGMPPKEGW